ncbi:ATPase [Treponema primitia ZAS-2]|uniref:ATPase n=1 Tax=Treponema primitia (strain ATCC BAA-887 / DSM 12427 / ZAS-2) TaxID=545694 RepID=F5YLD8_TREPZ|nr:ATP-binding protein [Treponema primitia]AEF84696.1 ATPase [Treponema primitia ZAS-2]
MSIADDVLKARADIAGLSVFSAIKKTPLVRAFERLLEEVSRQSLGQLDEGPGLTRERQPRNKAPIRLIRSWTAFTEALIQLPVTKSPALLATKFPAQSGAPSFYSQIAFLALTDDNPFTRLAEHGAGSEGQRPDSQAEASPKSAPIPAALRSLAKNDLARLGRLAAFDIPSLGAYIGAILRKAGLDDSATALEEEARIIGAQGDKTQGALFPVDTSWDRALPDLEKYLEAQGAGELGLYSAFFWAGTRSGTSREAPRGAKCLRGELRCKLRPVTHPDPIRLSQLSGYEDQRSIVIANTLRFLEGKAANNLLLYGDRGTGKSATVKAVCNEYASRRLRLLELRKGDLTDLPAILDLLSTRFLRFIVFIDDLSFESTGDAFTTLKALLEGGVEARPDNVVVYATSNRRHLVKEHMADRPTTAMAAEAVSTGDVRAFDSMQEQFSLADRFGVTVVYTAPSQDEYLNIACFIAEQRGILSPSGGEEARQRFREDALRWERWFNGRSPRTAVQFVDWAAAGGGFPWEI